MNLEKGLTWRDMFAVISISLVVKVQGENKITQTRYRREEVRDLTLRYPQQFSDKPKKSQQRMWKSENQRRMVSWEPGAGTVSGRKVGSTEWCQQVRDSEDREMHEQTEMEKAVFLEGQGHTQPEQMEVNMR